MKFNSKLSRYFVSGLLILSAHSIQSQNTDFDKKIGAENAKAADAEFGIYENEKLTAYVQSVGNRLVSALDETPFEFKFRIADDFTPNAFALPGGYVYVTRGILALVNTEDELAGVMAHEITHVTERHSIHQMRRGIIPQVLMLPGNIVGYVIGEHASKLINAPISITSAFTSNAYSRKQESEADTKGIALAAKAGYDPNALKNILDRLSKAIEYLTAQKERKSWLDDHPYTPDRIQNIIEVSKGITWQKKEGISANAISALDGLLLFDSPSKGIFNESVFIHPELGFTITFPKDWLTQNEANAVVAVRKDKKAAIYLGLINSDKTASEYAKEMEDDVFKKHKTKPVVSEPKGDSGYLVVLEDKSGKEIVYMHILWLKIGNNLFKLIGIAPKLFEENLKMTATSLRELNTKDRENIQISIMHGFKANKDETLKELANRSENASKLKGLSVINGLAEETKLKEGEYVKIVKKEYYKK